MSKVIAINDHFTRHGIAPDVARFLQCMNSCGLFDDVCEKIAYLNSRLTAGQLSREEAELIGMAQRIPMEWVDADKQSVGRA